MNAGLLFRVSAIVELLTGIAMLVVPLFVIDLLLGEGMSPIGIAVTRVLGIGLLSFGVAAWEPQGRDIRVAPRAGLCIYNVGVTVLLTSLGAAGGMSGLLLWPVAGLHGLLGALMVWTISANNRFDR